MNQQLDSPLDLEHMHSNRAVSPLLRHKGLAIGLIALGLSVFFTMWISYRRESWFSRWDKPVLTYFKKYRLSTPDWLTRIVQFGSNLGNMGLSLATTCLLGYWLIKRQMRHFCLLLASVLGVELLWLATTFLLQRTRPREIRTVFGIILPSFPSGHVMTSIAFLSTLLYLYLSHVQNAVYRVLISSAAVFWVLLTGWIRLYFSSHYITDILGGYGLGFAWTVFALTAVDYYFFKVQSQTQPQDEQVA